MLIPVSLGNIRTAIASAIKAAEQKFEADKAKLAEASFKQLHDGAVHNGLKPSTAEVQQMHDMADRDIEHAMESHESTSLKAHYQLMLEMADYFEIHDEDADAVVISHEEYRVLKDHLPAKAKKV